VFDGEWFSGAAHAGHDFIGNQQDAVAAADLGDALHVAFGRRHGAERGANNRLKYKCGNVLRILARKEPIELVGAYATFAAGGEYEEPRMITRIVGPDLPDAPI